MAQITITLSDAFVAAIQTEAQIDGMGAQAWAKQAIRDVIEGRRVARAAQTAEATRIQAVQAAAQTAESAYEATVEAERAAIQGLN